MRNLQAWTKLRAKTVTKAAECKLLKILLTRDRPEQFSSFFCKQFSLKSNHYEMKPRFQVIIFLKIQLMVWIACYFTVFTMLKTSFQNISKTLSQNLFKPQAYGLFFARGVVNHLPKKFLQVAQIFTKQSNRNEGRCNNIGRTGI